ncbi:MAG: hypothetical protein AABY11_02265 [archaeon]
MMFDQRKTQPRLRNPYAQAAATMPGLGGMPEQREPSGYGSLPGVMPAAPRTETAPKEERPEPNQQYQAAMDAYPKGGGGPRASRRALRQMGVANAHRGYEQLWDSLAELAAQSNPENLAESYGQQYEQMDDYFDQQQGALDRSLMERGLSDSSAAVGGQVGLARGRAQASAGLSNQIHGEARSRGDMLRQALMQLASGNAAQGGALTNAALSEKLQRELAKMQQGDWMDVLMSAAGSGAQIAKYT